MAKSRRFQKLDRGALNRVIGGADMSSMLQMASPLLGMMPGGSMISSFLPMIGQLANKGGGNAQAAAPQQQVASAQQAPQSAGDDMSQGQPALTGGGGSTGGGGRHHASVSVEIG